MLVSQVEYPGYGVQAADADVYGWGSKWSGPSTLFSSRRAFFTCLSHIAAPWVVVEVQENSCVPDSSIPYFIRGRLDVAKHSFSKGSQTRSEAVLPFHFASTSLSSILESSMGRLDRRTLVRRNTHDHELCWQLRCASTLVRVACHAHLILDSRNLFDPRYSVHMLHYILSRSSDSMLSGNLLPHCRWQWNTYTKTIILAVRSSFLNDPTHGNNSHQPNLRTTLMTGSHCTTLSLLGDRVAKHRWRFIKPWML